MKRTTFVGALTVAAMLGPSVFAQTVEPADQARAARDFMVLAGRGAEIGVQINEGKDGGVIVEEVRPDSPAEKAGLKRSDVIVEFDGERVRSARQFGRLVQETPPGRTVKTVVMRDGRRQELQVTPREGGSVLGRGSFNGDLYRERMPELDMLRDLPRGFSFNLPPDLLSDRRLGVTVDELTDQLAEYFGAKDGLLVTSVADGSAASRAGLRAGDVITSIDGREVRYRADIARVLRDSREEEIKIGIVRDKRESSVTAKIERPSTRSRGVRL